MFTGDNVGLSGQEMADDALPPRRNNGRSSGRNEKSNGSREREAESEVRVDGKKMKMERTKAPVRPHIPVSIRPTA